MEESQVILAPFTTLFDLSIPNSIGESAILKNKPMTNRTTFRHMSPLLA